MSDFLKIIGENIRFYRKQKGLTQEELAERTGLQSTYIGGIERGERNISLETFEKVSQGLEIPPISFFDFSTIDIEKKVNLSKESLLYAHQSLISSRSGEEIILIHNTVKSIIELLDSRK
ncbi:helix-turn-helix domain-containing protein [Neobacillus vireti]|uniref:helix-turn-helix domain-containing protein n=1 Tax=Neobacillus vireti TaxID=220686 RepID=UPI0030003583